MDILIALFPLVAGELLDKLLGDPVWLPHPVVAFGKAIARCERLLNRGGLRLLKGGFTAVALVCLVYFATSGLMYLFRGNIWVKTAIESVLVFYCLAGTTLVKEVRNVFRAADRSLAEGRKQVARIVGRDTQDLSLQEVRTAALETLAENLSDGVIAPLFWYLLLGVPGMMAYKMVNTLDSMIGYRNERYLLFGRVAARLDDAANYLPARLTAFLMVLSAGQLGLLRFVARYGPQHASPNSGYPEAALAGILNCRFGGSHHYFGEVFHKPYIGNHERELGSRDMEKAIRVNLGTELLMFLFVIAIKLLMA